jgi:NTP pyrophosphatase (non-canonical NTP hydrolase)
MDKFEFIMEELSRFRDERNWKKYHNPKDLAISISIEAAELLEIFQWRSEDEINAIVNARLSEIKSELADILIYSLYLVDVLKFDIMEIILDKIKKNRKKYPRERLNERSENF